MEKMPKIALLRWDADQISDVLMKLETLPGNSTNPDSYPFDVALVHVKGANMDTVEVNPCQELLDEYIRVCKELAAQGVKAITTSCGFNAFYQEALAAAVPEVVFTSSLLQVPFAQTIVGKNGKVAILTANANDLTEEHLPVQISPTAKMCLFTACTSSPSGVVCTVILTVPLIWTLLLTR